jgi:O-acetylhomoserine/O-acetylserine sulfhydrylase-like pyridoxal-dependent enzyme
MSANDDIHITPGMQDYIDKNNAYLAERDRYIREVVKKWKFDTIAVHGLYTMEDALEDYQGSIIEPIFMSTAQAFHDSDEMAAALGYLIPSWSYSRIANPSTYYYEWTLALLEGYGFDGHTECCSTSSGMAAIMTAVQPFLVHRFHKRLEPRNFVATAQCYGGTFQQFQVRLSEERDIECRWVEDPTNLDEWAATQPRLAPDRRFHRGHTGPAATDLSRRGHRRAIGDQVADQQRVWHRRCGHRAQPARDDHRQRAAELQAVMSLNDMRTLRSKMDRLSQGTMQVARFLETHPDVESVQYLGLPNHPLHELASKYMWLVDAEHDEGYGEPVNRYGHLMSFCVKGGPERTREFFDGLQRIWRATDLGRIKSVATIPAISTHQQQGEEGRQLAHIPSNLVRLCVGGEHPDDVIGDLDQALHRVGTSTTAAVGG